MMESNRFEYFLNAVHYFIYLEEIWSNKKIEKIILSFFSILFSEKYMQKINDRQKNKELKDFRYGNKWGLSIGVAHHWFGFFYSGYPCFFSWLLLGIASRMYGDEMKGMVVMLIIAFPISLGYIPAYRAVFSKDRYLKYFKQFEKENEQWHKKWKMITWAFCIGALITMAIGFFAWQSSQVYKLKMEKLAIISDTRNENQSIYTDYQNNVYTDIYNTVRATVSETIIWYGLWKKIERNDEQQ